MSFSRRGRQKRSGRRPIERRLPHGERRTRLRLKKETMNSYSYLRSVLRISVCAASLAAFVSFSSAAERQHAQAQLLDHAAFLCQNCFFGPSDYYYCFAVDDQVLIGYQRTPVLNWQDKSKNYLTKVHQGGRPGPRPARPCRSAMTRSTSGSVERKRNRRGGISGAHVKAIGSWATRSDGKQVRLTQKSLPDIFTHNDRCRHADRAEAQ